MNSTLRKRLSHKALDHEHLSGADLARLLYVNRSTPGKWAAEGCPRNDGKTFALAVVVTWLVEREKAKRPAFDGDALERWRMARAQREEIQLERDRGRLVELEVVVRTWQKHVTDARTILQTPPDAIGLLLTDGDLRELVHNESERIVRDALLALAEGNVNHNQNGGNGVAKE